MKIFVVGPMPPPVYGMSAVNGSVAENLRKADVELQIINLAAPNLSRGLRTRFRRLLTVIHGLLGFGTKSRLQGQVLYISVSDGLGQIYELLFVCLARIQGMRIILHHHSFAYLGTYKFLTQSLIQVAGPSSIHVALSQQMAERLRVLYGTTQVVSISNAVFLLGKKTPQVRFHQQSTVLGFISNIVPEKGIYEFLHLMKALQAQGLPITAKVAGPFQDIQTQKTVCKYLENLHNTEYVGPKYGVDKDNFYDNIDVLVFPTKKDAEPLTIHEAMSRGIPVVSYGRGCIPEIVDSSCGLVVPLEEDFVPAALAQIHDWNNSPEAFQSACKAAAARSSVLYAESLEKWEGLKSKMIQGTLNNESHTRALGFPSEYSKQ